MEPPTSMLQRRRKAQEPISIHVKSEAPLSASSCVAIVEDLVKYILYQRCQIPVPFAALVREAGIQSLAQQRQEADPPPQDLASRKKEIMKQKLQRKRQQWLSKVNKFLQNFNFLRESLLSEFKSGSVRGVNIILGSSVMTGREIYFIKLPANYNTLSNGQPLRAQQTGVQLFRSLVTNEALLNIMNRPCGVQRVWVMVQKSSGPQPDTITAAAGSDDTAPSLIPRPEYSQNLRATVVEISIQHSSVAVPMDLTPTVGSGITFQGVFFNKTGIKRSLYLNSPGVSQFYNQNALHCSFQDCTESERGSTMAISDGSKKKMFPVTSIDNSKSTYVNRPFLETPVKIFKEDVAKTPIQSSVAKAESFTPSKQLASQLGTFNLNDSPPDTAWYQIDCLMSGFRDMCVRS